MQKPQINIQDIRGEIYFDIETWKLAEEVPGGWKNILAFGMALAVTWDINNQFRSWREADAKALIKELNTYDRVVSFNGDRFDFEVLSAYGTVTTLRQKSFDLMPHLVEKLGHRVSLDHLVQQTLGLRKSGNGLECVEWLRKGQFDRATQYCKRDVEILVHLVAHARQHGFVVVDGGKVAVQWIPAKAPLTLAARAGK